MRNHDDSSSNQTVSFPSQVGRLTPGAAMALTTDLPENASNEGVVAYWRMVMRHKWIVVLTAFVGTAAGILITLPQTPVYQSRTSLEVQGINENFLNFQNL